MHIIPYLNRGQMLEIERSEEAYLKRYGIDGRPLGINRGMALGSTIANALEKDEETGNAMKDFVVAMLPKYEIRDKMFYIDMKIGKEIIPIRIQPDSLKDDMSAFYEYKTGAEKSWTQKKVDEDDQITFYATGIYIKTKKIPRCELIWAPTRKVVGEDGIERPELTGEIVRFQTIRRMSHILKMMGRMRNAWTKIGELTEREII